MNNSFGKILAVAAALALPSLGHAQNTIPTNDIPPTVSLTAPADGAVFRAPVNVTLSANAADSDGTVVRVSFLSGTQYLGGVSTAPFTTTWTNPAPGTYAVVARAADNYYLNTTSAPASVTILPPFPVVTISTTHYDTMENGTNPASFRVARSTGDLSAPLTVYYNVSGNASNGVDYQFLPGSVTIPTGTNGATILVQPIDDSLVEGTETVIVSLAASAPTAYLVGSYSTASAIILDDETNKPPSVSITSPTNNSVFPAPSDITFTALANDVDGSVARVDYLSSYVLIGSATAPPYAFTWTNVPAGYYIINARATDNLGASNTSYSVHFTVGVPPPVVTLKVLDAIASEPGTDTALFQVMRTGGDQTIPVTVNYAVTGTASNGVDYDLLPGNVTIPANASNATILIHPIDDNIPEPPESVILTLIGGNPAGPYIVGSPSSGSATILDNDNALPTVTMTSPTNNANLPARANILLTADASDTDGSVIRVMFMSSSTTVLGYATNAPWTFLWTNVQTGTYSVYARAMDNLDGYGISAPVQFTVGLPPRPVVSIQTLVSQVPESGPNAGVIQVTRTGDTSSQLSVNYAISGTATNGVDYFQLPNSIAIPAGATNAQILVQPIDVHIYGGSQYASFYLLSNATYTIGSPTYGSVTILDYDQHPTNTPPTVAITAPANGAIFGAPANIAISADASDSDGTVASVSFYAGSVFLGVVSNAPYAVTWTNVPPGFYTLTARAVDNLGAPAYSSVKISVVSTNPHPYATRYLPGFYIPGAHLTVNIAATPIPGTSSFTLVDHPLLDWTVGPVSDGGIFDPAQNAVTFGPFTNIWPRNVNYAVTPPAGEDGRKYFAGFILNDSGSNTIGGAYAINRAPAHPADNNPTNLVIDQAELAAYNTAWSTTEKANPPNPLPISYLTRAGFLYALGGGYTFSLATPPPNPPLLWVSTNLPPTAAGAPNSVEQPWQSNAVGTSVSVGIAVSSMPSNYTPGTAFTVSIAVTPGTQTLAFAVQDRPPRGWQVSNITGGGVFAPLTATVKWGLFSDNSPRTLTYGVTPPSVVPTNNSAAYGAFAGVASFNGIDTPVVGQRYVRAAATVLTPPASLAPTITSSADPQSPANLFTFPGDAGSQYTIEAAGDLNSNWSPLDTLLNNDGTLQYMDPNFGASPAGFYRASPAQDNSTPPPVP